MLVFEFLHRIIDVLTDYLGDISEASIRENFVIVYQVRSKRERQMKGEN
jgi:AP-3 complex subunit mu